MFTIGWNNQNNNQTKQNTKSSNRKGNTATDIISLQRQKVANTKAELERAREQTKKDKDNYDLYLNSQQNTDDIDILSDGGSSSRYAQDKGSSLWKTYMTSKNIETSLQSSLEKEEKILISYLKNPREAAYQGIPLTELETMISAAEDAVVTSQQAYRIADANYSTFFSTDADDLQMGTSGNIDEQKLHQSERELRTASENLAQAMRNRDILLDNYTFRSDMQIISGMSEANRIALELCTNGIDIKESAKVIASLTPEQRKILKSTGNYFEILSNPKQFLKRSGYGKEDISRLTESYGRYLNALEMETTENTAQKIGNATPILGTVSTYPANLIGGISSDLTAFGSTMASDMGFSHYNTIDVNHPGYQASVYVDALRGTVSDNLGEFGGVIYDKTNNYLDGAVSKIAASNSGIPILKHTGNFGTTVRDATINGATKDQAMNFGINNTGRAIIDDLVFYGTLPDDPSEFLIFNSEFNTLVEKLMNEGMDEKTARETAYYHITLSSMN